MESPSTSVINLQSVGLIRREKKILHDLNWRVLSGQHWVVFGPNGAGKTSLLKLLTGYLRPTLGDGFVLGRRLGHTNVEELRQLIGWVSRDFESLIHAEDKGIDIVLSGKTAGSRLWYNPTDQDLEKAHTILAHLALTKLEENTFGTMSQGEQKKILIARALFNDPQILILDEPCVGLDFVAREEFLNDIVQFVNLKKISNVILVTHHPEEIVSCFSHVLLMRQGTSISAGSIETNFTGKQLSYIFDRRIKLSIINGRFSAELSHSNAIF